VRQGFMITSFFKNKFRKDLLWNLVSLGIQGIIGVVLNILIGRYFGAETLGVFNQIFALHLALSQIAVMGIHLSVLKHVAQYAETPGSCDPIISSAIVLTAISAGIITCAGYFLSHSLGRLFNSSLVARGWLFVLPGLWFYPLNKVMSSVLNGFRHMKSFAIAEALRFIFMLLALLGCRAVEVAPSAITLIISGAEALLFLFLISYTLRFYTFIGPGKWGKWTRAHIIFGTKGLASGTMVAVNSKVDVLMLGYFGSDRQVGIYSVASVLIAGFMRILAVVRNNINPLLTQYITQNRHAELIQFIKKNIRYTYAGFGIFGLAAALLFPVYVRTFYNDPAFMQSWAPFAILMGGLILYAGYLPLNMILTQAGYPGLHSLFRGSIVFSNIVLNLIFIPILGIKGAAIATAISYLASILYLKIITRKKFGINI